MKPKAGHQLNGETHDIRETLWDGIVVAKRLVEEADYLIETSREVLNAASIPRRLKRKRRQTDQQALIT